MPLAECKCEAQFTCGFCLRNAPPWLWTYRTEAEMLHDQINQPTTEHTTNKDKNK